MSTQSTRSTVMRSVTAMDCRRSVLATWLGAAPIAVLLALPMLVDVVESGSPRRAALLALVVAAALLVWPVALAAPRLLPWASAAAAAVLTATAVVTTRELGEAWLNVWLVLAILVGGLVALGVAGTAAGLAGVAGVTAAAGAVVASAPVERGAPWSVMLTVSLSGVSTIVLVRLLATVRELRATRQELADRAVLADRDRLSRDLHDLLGHSLSLVVVKSEVVRRLVDVDPAAAARHAQDVAGIGRRSLAEVRQAVAGIRGTTLATELERARQALADAGIEAEVTAAPSLLPEPVDAAFAWVVREGTTNVIRHSGARRCSVHVGVDESDDGSGGAAAEVRITDDGTGPAGALREGNGLTGLRSRLEEVGGDLLVLRDLDHYRLTARAPLATAAPTGTP